MPENLKVEINRYYQFWFGINALYDNWAKEHELTPNALFTLYMIREYEGYCTQKLICEKLLLPKQTVNTLLDVFEQKGYIEKKTMEDDRRNKELIFTKSGREYADKILGQLYELESRSLEQMSAKHRKDLIEGSELFLKQLILSRKKL